MGKHKIAFYTQGCRLNQSETAVLEKGFEKDQYQLVGLNEQPEIVVVNTCTVTENGDADTRRLVNKINRDSPNAHIALIGCQAQILKETLLSLKNVKWVVGNAQKMGLGKIITDSLNQELPIVLTEKIKRESFTIKDPGIDKKHKRANIKIQDGCDFYCAFCVIPFARGPARSREFNDIIRECMALTGAGHQEIVLTGINIGTYENEGKGFLDVVKALDQLEGLDRVRISSIEPTTVPDELIALMNSNSKCCPYLHIPLQSGSDLVLERMARKYTVAEFDAFIQAFAQKVPDVCIGTDVIVGFPGETDDSFEETYTYLKESPIHYFHVFSYSERKFARSKKFSHQVPVNVIKERSQRLRDLSKRKKAAFMGEFVGKTLPVLFEQQKKGIWTGLTTNYIRVAVKSSENLENQIRPVTLGQVEDQHMIGTL